MGIQIEEVPKGGTRVSFAGPLTLPVEFDTKKWAAKWVKVGPAVAAAGEREYIVGAVGVTADGWLPWTDPKGESKGKPHKVALASGEHILLCRLREVQDAVNAIYGNIGKERMIQERTGETTGGIPTNDAGLLSDSRLTKVIGKEELTADEGDVILNKVPNVRRIERPVIEVAG